LVSIKELYYDARPTKSQDEIDSFKFDAVNQQNILTEPELLTNLKNLCIFVGTILI